MLRSIDRFVDLGDIRKRLKPIYNDIGRASIDPDLVLRMLIVGYVIGIRLESQPDWCPTLTRNGAPGPTRTGTPFGTGF